MINAAYFATSLPLCATRAVSAGACRKPLVYFPLLSRFLCFFPLRSRLVSQRNLVQSSLVHSPWCDHITQGTVPSCLTTSSQLKIQILAHASVWKWDFIWPSLSSQCSLSSVICSTTNYPYSLRKVVQKTRRGRYLDNLSVFHGSANRVLRCLVGLNSSSVTS